MDNHDLFQQYIEICNAALRANKDRFPFKQILTAAQNQQNRPKNIEVAIVQDKPKAAYVIQMEADKISGKPHAACSDCTCEGQWRVTRTYLEDVIKNPEAYISNPAKIDWAWLYPKGYPE
jgi:hypothetical protein